MSFVNLSESRTTVARDIMRVHRRAKTPAILTLVFCNHTGDKFDLKEFHDVVLLESALPMSVLEELVDQYISSHK